MLAISAAVALFCWAAVLLLPWQPHRTRERWERSEFANGDLSDVAVLIPARNEAASIASTLNALAAQGENLRVYVVDDESTDATATTVVEVAARLAAASSGRRSLAVELISGKPLPDGWGGKLWALHQGFERIDRPHTLLLDAEIELAPNLLPGILRFLRQGNFEMVSIMARLRCEHFWEKLLVPPFIFFYKLLYPFALVNSSGSSVAAAAGGFILLKTDVLKSAGGFKAIKDALIDDCSLAALMKRRGCRLWLGLSREVCSMRAYDRLSVFWRMVSRTAFTQLRYSILLLVLTTVLMLLVFAAPLAALVSTQAVVVGGLALTAMALSYWPVVRYYELPLLWIASLPLAAGLFLAMTWSSAIGYWCGRRAIWKERVYETSKR